MNATTREALASAQVWGERAHTYIALAIVADQIGWTQRADTHTASAAYAATYAATCARIAFESADREERRP